MAMGEHAGKSMEVAVSKSSSSTLFFVELLALILIFIMVGIASYTSVRDLMTSISPQITYLEISDIILNDIFMLIILAELIRFITALRASPGSRVIGLAEVGIIVSIREVIIASLTKEYLGLLLASSASLLLALMILLVRAKVMRE
ncbi:MAG: phosphate-starvation-inducible PsiE family protein [Sulfolobales archaeon]|nr:phosphate-starvation-inducible PsiE family protein [Sulfolobales archaeon]